MEEIKERPLTQDEKVEGVVAVLTEIGAVYKSHNQHNLYVKVKKDSILDDEKHFKKAIKTVFLYTGLILRFDGIE